VETRVPLGRTNPNRVPRRSQRADRRGLAFVVATTEDRRVPRRVLILDLSPHGARVQCDVPLTPGQAFEFVPPEGPEYAVRCRVIWAGELGSNSEGESGLEFLAPYPTDLPA
jgi:hypothetical protein